MKNVCSSLTLLLVGFLLSIFYSCHSHDAAEDVTGGADEVRVYFLFTLDTSTGTPMHRAPKTNAEVFDEFYDKLQTGELVAPNYELTLTDMGSGAEYTFRGQWGTGNYVTLRTGTYHVVGTSTAEGENIQERCSFTFDETINVRAGNSAVTLHADYDCFLLVFAGGEFRSLQNYNGEAMRPFFTFGDYRYAFVNSSLFNESGKDAAYIEGEYNSGTAFRIMTGKLAFERGKYYIYNTATGGFDIPRMDEGDESGDDNTGGEGGGEEGENGTSGDEDTPAGTYAYEMVTVPAGTFLMGSPDDLADASADERPQHSVTLSSFQIGKYEVTQQLWKEVMGTNPSYFQGTKVKTQNLTRPVEMVNKADVEQFITKLNELTGQNYRLPTEEEWEYAARGGSSSTWLYAGANDVASVAWYSNNSSSETHPVADKSKNPNALGIYGMSGNVYEWTSSPRTDSYEAGAAVNTSQYVVRGGSFQNGANSCRVAYRNFVSPNERRNYLGLRLVKD